MSNETTAQELIEALQKLPPDTIIEVLKECSDDHDISLEWNSVNTKSMHIIDYGTPAALEMYPNMKGKKLLLLEAY